VKRAARLVVAAAALLAGGCVNLGSAEHPPMHRHALDAASGVEKHAGAAAAGISVHPFAARARYDVRIVRRDGADDFTYLEFDRWAEPPADAATDSIREGLAASGAFQFVAAATDAIAVDRFLDGYVLAFDLVRTPSGPWKAHLEVRLSVSDRAGKLLASAVYDASRDLPGASPVGVGPAMSAAVGDVVNRAVADWTKSGAMK